MYIISTCCGCVCVCLCRCLCLDTASRCSLLSVSLLILTSTPQHSIAFAHSFSLRLGLVSFAVSLFFSQCLLNLPCVCVWVLRCLRRVCVRVCAWVCVCVHMIHWNDGTSSSFSVLEYECVNKEGLDFLAPTVVKVKPFPWRPLCPRRPERPGPAGRQSSHVGLMEKSMTPRHPITHNYRL